MLLLIASVLLIIFIFGDHGMYQLYHLRAERSANQALITELRKERGKLEEEKFRLKNIPNEMQLILILIALKKLLQVLL